MQFNLLKYDVPVEQATAREREVQSRKRTDDRLFEAAHNSFADSNYVENLSEYDHAIHLRSKALEYFVSHSVTQCAHCGAATYNKLQAGYLKMRIPTASCDYCIKTGRISKATRYHIPVLSNYNMDGFLLNSYNHNLEASLSPFQIDVGPYKLIQNGYRVKTSCVSIKVKKEDVTTNIKNEVPSHLQANFFKMYQHLLSNSECTLYQKYHAIAEELRKQGQIKLNIHESFSSDGLECAIWPILYMKDVLSDTNNNKKIKLHSFKSSFMVKLSSCIMDYSHCYNLLQFMFDRWLYRTVSGAINAAKISHCSPNYALETKMFHPTYWKNHFNMLVDAIKQHGYPHLFVTINPYEWTFPTSNWLKERMELLKVTPTRLGINETQNIFHILNEIVTGYLTGSSESRKWNGKCLFSDQSQSATKLCFYRNEFQGRLSMHIHILLWFHEALMSFFGNHDIRGHLPTNDKKVFSMARARQVAKDSKHTLPVYEDETNVQSGNINLHYPSASLDMGLRGYISSILLTLKCCMDVQCGNGKTMLLKYVTDYVSKLNANIGLDELTRDLNGWQAAYKYLFSMNVGIPEMYMLLSTNKLAHCTELTKTFTMPHQSRLFGTGPNAKWLKAYVKRQQNVVTMSLLEFMRTHTFNKAGNCVPYKSGSKSLVGCYIGTFLKDSFLLNWTILNVLFQQIEDLYPPNFESVPDSLKGIKIALFNKPELWTDPAAIMEHFIIEGHREFYIENFVHKIGGLIALCNLQATHQLTFHQLQFQDEDDAIQSHSDIVLSDKQKAFVAEVDRYLHLHPTLTENDLEEQPKLENKPLLVIGKPGTGKSTVLQYVVNLVGRYDNGKMLIATPTGLLARNYQDLFPDSHVDKDTVHSAFHIPVGAPMSTDIVWPLMKYHVIAIDEISQVHNEHMKHILNSCKNLPYPPILLLFGDKQQTPPVGQKQSCMHHQPFLAQMTLFNFTTQFRVVCPILQRFLDIIRSFIPTQQQLFDFCQDKVLTHGNVTKKDIVATYENSCTFLTSTNNASNFINDIIVEHLFGETPPLAVVIDGSGNNLPIYIGMNLRITENRNKKCGIVNGANVTVVDFKGNSILVKLCNGKVTIVNPVSSKDRSVLQIQITYLPVKAAYSSTIFKSQGANLNNVCIWFDNRNISQEGSAYVACSRVKTEKNIKFLTQPLCSDFQPVTLLSLQR